MVTSLVRSGVTYSKVVEKEASGEIAIEEAIPANQTDYAINIAIDVSALQSLYIFSDQDLTIQTNDGTTPDDTIAVNGGVPIWYDESNDSIFPNPLTADVTVIYVTNTTAATLRIFALYDATP